MMKAAPSLLALLALAACDSPELADNAADTQQSQPAPGPNPVQIPPAAPTVVLPAPVDLVGEWRVAGIDGEALTGDIGIAVSIDEMRIGFGYNCQLIAWSYRYSQGELSTRRVRDLAAGEGRVDPPPCAAPLPPTLRRFAEAIDTATTAGRTPENGVLLSGGGHSVTLFSQ